MKKTIYTMMLATVTLSLAMPISGFAAWQRDGTNWKYEVDGIYASDEWKEIDGHVYHFSANRIMDTGWKELDGYWYYFDSDGQMLTGERVIDRKAYTFDTAGRMILEGIHRDGLEDDLLSEAFVKTHGNWQETIYAIELTNQERAKMGVALVTLDYDLTLIATYCCAHMDKYNYFTDAYNNESFSDTIWKAYTGIDTVLGRIMYINGDIDNPTNGVVFTKTMHEFVVEAYNDYLDDPLYVADIIKPTYIKAGVGIFRNKYQTRDYTVTLFCD